MNSGAGSQCSTDSLTDDAVGTNNDSPADPDSEVDEKSSEEDTTSNPVQTNARSNQGHHKRLAGWDSISDHSVGEYDGMSHQGYSN